MQSEKFNNVFKVPAGSLPEKQILIHRRGFTSIQTLPLKDRNGPSKWSLLTNLN